MAKKSIETQIKENLKQLKSTGVSNGRKSVYPNIAFDFAREKYYVTFDYGKIKDGRKKTQQVFDTPKEAAGALEGFLADKRNDAVLAPDPTTMEEYCNHWLRVHCASRSASTKIFYDNIVSKHIIPALGKKQLQSISVADINRFLSAQLNVKGKGGRLLGASTVKKHRDTLCTIFEAAVNEDILSKNPAKRSNVITVRKEAPDAFSNEEVRRIIKCAVQNEKTPHSEAYRLALYTGMRKGELLGLRWQNVHLDHGCINIKESRTDTTIGATTDNLKTDTSARTIHLTPDAKTILAALKERYESNKELFGDAFHDDGFVICYDDGSLYLPRSLSRAFEKFLKRNDIRVLPFHALRHTFGTLQRMSGASAYDIKELMGHSSVTIAEKNYIKPFSGQQRQAHLMNLMQDIISGTPPTDDKG